MAINADLVNTKSNAFNATRADQHGAQRRAARVPSGAASTRCSQSGGRATARCSCASRSACPIATMHTVSYTLQKVEDNPFGATSTGTITDFYHPEYDAGHGNADRRHSAVASGALPAARGT